MSFSIRNILYSLGEQGTQFEYWICSRCHKIGKFRLEHADYLTKEFKIYLLEHEERLRFAEPQRIQLLCGIIKIRQKIFRMAQMGRKQRKTETKPPI